MSGKSNWEMFFDAHAPQYEENVFTKNTQREVEFLIAELQLPPGSRILDVGCGTGRHAIALAKHGYAVTGIDLSRAMLAVAAENADAEGVAVQWVHADATRFTLDERFDAALGLCEGAFGLLSVQDDPVDQPIAILRNISRCLKPGAKAVFTVLNAAKMMRQYSNADVADGRFDPVSLTEHSAMSPQEGMDPVPTRERSFVPTEFRLFCRLAGLDVMHIWGGTAGNWGRRPVDLDEYEIMIIAEKRSDSE